MSTNKAFMFPEAPSKDLPADVYSKLYRSYLACCHRVIDSRTSHLSPPVTETRKRHMCQRCHETFSSKNQMHAHIRETRHNVSKQFRKSLEPLPARKRQPPRVKEEPKVEIIPPQPKPKTKGKEIDPLPTPELVVEAPNPEFRVNPAPKTVELKARLAALRQSADQGDSSAGDQIDVEFFTLPKPLETKVEPSLANSVNRNLFDRLGVKSIGGLMYLDGSPIEDLTTMFGSLDDVEGPTIWDEARKDCTLPSHSLKSHRAFLETIPPGRSRSLSVTSRNADEDLFESESEHSGSVEEEV